MRRYITRIAATVTAGMFTVAVQQGHFLKLLPFWLEVLIVVAVWSVAGVFWLSGSKTFRTIVRNLPAIWGKLSEDEKPASVQPSIRIADEALRGGPEIAVEYSVAPGDILAMKDRHHGDLQAAYKALHEKRLTVTNDSDDRAYGVQIRDIVYGTKRVKFKNLYSLPPHSGPIPIEHEIEGSRSGARSLLRFFSGDYPDSSLPPIPPFDVVVSYWDADSNRFETHGSIIFDRATQTAHYEYKGRVLIGKRA